MIRSFTTRTRPYPITITKNAWDKMTQIINTKNKHTPIHKPPITINCVADGIRHPTQIVTKNNFLFSATSGGCNGFNYNLQLFNKNDNIVERFKIKPTIIKKNNIHVVIDPMSEMLLLGTTIDYISENYQKNIFDNKFIFIPDKNIASSCGCGISFTPK